MGEVTKIQWCDHTFNPWIGCQRVSPGCEHCYAETQDSRKRWGGITHWGPTSPRHRTSESTWKNPLAWNRAACAAGVRARVFCASLADVFEDRDDLKPWRADLFNLIMQTPCLDWLLLTKRPENISRLHPEKHLIEHARTRWPNVWLGTTVEDRKRADERTLALVRVPAVVHFLSVEPQLELVVPNLDGIEWVICGGESGPGARPFDIAWARALRDQCAQAGVAFFMKQLGQRTRMRPADVGGDLELEPMVFSIRPKEIGDPNQRPTDLWVRQWPEVARG